VRPFKILRMRPPLVSSWSVARAATLNSDVPGWAGYTIRQELTAAGLADISATQMRFTFTAASTGPLNIAKAYVGLEGGTALQFSAAPTPILFGGSAGVAIAQNAAQLSDAVAFAYDGTANLVVSIYTSGAAAYRCNATNANGTVKYKAGDDAITQAATGYATQPSFEDVLALIEVS
jgi:hypothetical protein